jgi:hypothetical protein
MSDMSEPAPLTFSQEFGKIAEALAKAQGAFTNPPRNREVKVPTKSGGSYTFAYATLDAILDMVRQPLAANGLCYVHTLAERGGKFRLVTRLIHTSGQWIESEAPLFVAEQSNQAFGSALTYMKRYALCALLGIAADEDDDANAAEGNVAEKRDRAPPRKQPPAEPPMDERRIKDAASAIASRLKKADQVFALDLAWEDSKDVRAKLPKVTQDYLRNLYDERGAVLGKAA